MKYKVGNEVLVKVQIIEEGPCTYGLRTSDGVFLNARKDTVLPVPTMSADEAWDIAKKILLYPKCGGFNAIELEEIFGRTEHLWEMTPQQAKAKIEAWKAAKVIKVGDEVALKSSPNNDGCKFFVTFIDNKNGEISGWSGFGGGVFYGRNIKQYQKTGRHIDIDGLLRNIGGDE